MTLTVLATDFGGPEVLSVLDVPVAAPGPAEVLVGVRAVGTNPVDFKSYSGAFGRDPAQLPIRLGREASGIVRAVGDDVEGPGGPIRVGDEVVVYPVEGAYADELLVPAASVRPKPSTMSFAEASGLMVAGTTAIHALTVTGVKAGKTVVIHGGSGGVGLVAIQLAVANGAHVIATASPPRHAYLRELGAVPVSYGEGLIERLRSLAPAGFDAAIDMVGTDEALDASVALVADRQRIATIAGFQKGFELGVRVLGGAPGADPGVIIRSTARMELVRLAEAGSVGVLVAETFPLSEAAAAHRELARGHTHGKIVLLP